MGQFSWLDCQDQRQILDNVRKDVYALIPKEFGGGHIHEKCYDGYGHFGGRDMYSLVADWNREYLSKNPEYVIKTTGEKVSNFAWYQNYANLNLLLKEVRELLGEHYRDIGINIACYDKDNENLLYPIKITHDKNAVYEKCLPSQKHWQGSSKS